MSSIQIFQGSSHQLSACQVLAGPLFSYHCVISSPQVLTLSRFSGALNRHSSIQNVVRDNMKAVRTREESLHDLQRRRWCTAASVESIKKKLTRMNHTKAFVDHFMQGHARFGCKIAHEQSTITVFKRKCTKNWLTLKFRGLAEYCEKGMVCSVRRANYEEMLRWVRGTSCAILLFR
ncbi:hypothetical protein DEU56DRAFT_325739 [Suillus clintonianus]|uniref:uncharacterized protein n=1 Tax=Suillus clintonianus TaxID=1904413 RepID=UPI001B864962|nr:uncharacterized protein DEU56DRAFT_325739 [Suillus clintonianus]KAG2139289.1 hypothetical protein DEU56DRAFT_325739 [Suillus clintonianus]